MVTVLAVRGDGGGAAAVPGSGLASVVTMVPTIKVKVPRLSGGRRRRLASVSPPPIEALGADGGPRRVSGEVADVGER
jgi:hypothetical protein